MINALKHGINTHFQGTKIPEKNEYCTCLSVILIDSVVKIENDYYRQMFKRNADMQ